MLITMKKTFLIIILTIIYCNLNANDYRAKLFNYGRFDHITISPSEDLFYGIYEGNLYKSNGFDKLWYSVSIKEAPKDEYSDRGEFKEIHFLSNDIILAFSTEFEKGEYTNYVYKSTKRGETWGKTKIQAEDWIQDIFIEPNR